MSSSASRPPSPPSPKPRPGPLGVLDSFIGPDATAAELFVQFVPTVCFALVLSYRAFQASFLHSGLRAVVFVLLAIDLPGGVLTNSTRASKRWYHRQGRSAAHHLLFVLPHTLHILAVALLFRAYDWTFFATASLSLLFGAALVLSVPLYLKNVVGMLVVLVAVFEDLYVWKPTPFLEWFVPLLFLKICVAHLVPEQTTVPSQQSEAAIPLLS
ncbi:hypothetical protein BWQ96_01310 [Gracilariopsis chorda]|uniref:Uncharacterized protein n=1 Tax=Gracilariopsis chorda TaxID=448386 RepID=A0A2V3J3I0_9FLOR|nr:hypothetical protein BWQ96_01310 [Gracilariopsis chorda]|eukprot:PXF48968.1 hypothetical protein BWQ96_01310 [Gracilariopsis chorda]